MISEEAAKSLRAPFPESAIGQLPRAGITLAYVGHAATTDRLLSVDPAWSWEPLALDDDGFPKIRQDGKNLTMWIRLTVCGVTRLGVGSVKADAFDPEKQLIGDAIRNAAMRFGVALDLWTKQDLDDGPARTDYGDRTDPGPSIDLDAGPLTTETISSLKPRELNDALVARGLALGGSIPEQRDRLYHWSQASVAGESPSPDGEIAGNGETIPVAASPAAVSVVAEDASTREGSIEGGRRVPDADPALEGTSSAATPDATPAGAVPIPDSGKGYEAWTRADLMAECASRAPVIDTLSNATKPTLIEQLRSWDRLHDPDGFEWSERPL